MREARIHVRHVRDLLKSLDPSDAFNGVDCNSLSFLSVFTDGDLGGAQGVGAGVWAEGPGACWPRGWGGGRGPGRPSHLEESRAAGAQIRAAFAREVVGPWVALC